MIEVTRFNINKINSQKLSNLKAKSSPDVQFQGNLTANELSNSNVKGFYLKAKPPGAKLDNYLKSKNIEHKNIEVSFTGRSGKAKNRGLMMHISHLPATRSAIGQFLDPETTDFINFLKEAKQTHWIINPLTPIGDDLSPYNASSRFDRNKYMVNLNVLTSNEYGNILKESDLPEDVESKTFTLEKLQNQKDPCFKKALANFKKLDETHPLKVEFNNFIKENGEEWVNDNSLFEGIQKLVKNSNQEDVYAEDWKSWSNELKYFPENTEGMSFEQKIEALKDLKINGKSFGKEEQEAVEIFRLEQFLFNKQFGEFKEELDDAGVQLFVDLAYAVSPSGKDVWANKDIVCLDENNEPAKLTGCMPEPAYPNTQMWGQAVWNTKSNAYWDYQEKTLKHLLKEGCVRLDHFGGLVNRGAIPAKIKGADGNTYSIFEAIDKKIKLPEPYKGVDGTIKDFADKDIWYDNWLEDVSKDTNKKGENLLDLYLRIAEDLGLKPEDTFIVEDLGGVCETKTFKKTMKKYGDQLAGLRVPVQFGVNMSLDNYDMSGNVHHIYECTKDDLAARTAILSGSHDPQTVMETMDFLMKNQNADENKNVKSNSVSIYNKFCEEKLGLPKEVYAKKSVKNMQEVTMKTLEWLYKLPAKHMQTTISDALAIKFRPNIPGNWNLNPEVKSFGEYDDKDPIMTPQLPFYCWGHQLPKNFLGDKFKENTERFVGMMQKLFPAQQGKQKVN